jgi:hypothetical protein
VYYNYKWSEISFNENLKNLVSKLTFQSIKWKINMLEGNHLSAKQNLKKIEAILEQMKLYFSSYNIH